MLVLLVYCFRTKKALKANAFFAFFLFSDPKTWKLEFSPFDFWSYWASGFFLIWSDVFFHGRSIFVVDFTPDFIWYHFFDFFMKIRKNHLFDHFVKSQKANCMSFHGCWINIKFNYFCSLTPPNMFFIDFF